MDDGRRYETPGTEIKDSLLFIGRPKECQHFCTRSSKPQFPWGNAKSADADLNVQWILLQERSSDLR